MQIPAFLFSFQYNSHYRLKRRGCSASVTDGDSVSRSVHTEVFSYLTILWVAPFPSLCRPRGISINASSSYSWRSSRGPQCNFVGHHSGAFITGVVRPTVGVPRRAGHLLQPVDVLIVRVDENGLGPAEASPGQSSHDAGGAEGRQSIRGEYKESVLFATSEFRRQ